MPVTHRSGNTNRTQLTLAQVSGEFISIVGPCLRYAVYIVLRLDSNCAKTVLTVWYVKYVQCLVVTSYNLQVTSLL